MTHREPEKAPEATAMPSRWKVVKDASFEVDGSVAPTRVHAGKVVMGSYAELLRSKGVLLEAV